MMLTPQQLPSAHHNPSCDGRARDVKRIEQYFLIIFYLSTPFGHA